MPKTNRVSTYQNHPGRPAPGGLRSPRRRLKDAPPGAREPRPTEPTPFLQQWEAGWETRWVKDGFRYFPKGSQS